jgi:hypothetical protein
MAVTYTKLNELVASEEFSALDTPTQDHMRQAGVPDFEFAGVGLPSNTEVQL